MAKPVKRERLQSADREFRNAANRAIRGDIVRAINELLLNSDDSYSRKSQRSRKIVVEVERLSRGDDGPRGRITVRDWAEGMPELALDAAVGRYGEAGSGLLEGASVRGYFGHGLKDAILGLGSGTVHTFHGDSYTSATLTLNSAGTPIYSRYETVAATSRLRRTMGIPTGTGTVVEVDLHDGITIPTLDRLKETLSRHFLLRRLMSDPDAEVLLVYKQVTRAAETVRLQYPEPNAVATLLDEQFGWGDAFSARLLVKRAPVQLDPPSAGETSDGGILVCGGVAVLDHTLFKFEGDQGADYIFGFLESTGFDELLRREVPILQATRDGLVWNQQPLADLRRQVEERLAPVVEAERVRLRQQDQHARDRVLRERLNKAIVEFNRIADQELELSDGAGTGTRGEKPEDPAAPPVPIGGFGFLHEYVNVIVARDASITVRASTAVLDANAVVELELATAGDVLLASKSVQMIARRDFPEILEATIVVRGNRIGAQTLLTARCQTRVADCLVQVVAARTPPPPRPPSSGLFRDLRFDNQTDPRQRVQYDRASGDIVIHVLAPSVRLYIGEEGRGAGNGQGAVLCAELVLEAVCKELARRGVESGRFTAPSGGITEAINREYDQLRIKYAEQLHLLIVGEAAPPRRGRRPAAEAMAAAASPA